MSFYTQTSSTSPDNDSIKGSHQELKSMNKTTTYLGIVTLIFVILSFLVAVASLIINYRSIYKESVTVPDQVLTKSMTDDVDYKNFAVELQKTCSYFDKQVDMSQYKECLIQYLKIQNTKIDQLYQDINITFQNRKKASEKNNILYPWSEYFNNFPNTISSVKIQWEKYTDTLCEARVVMEYPSSGGADDFTICKIFEADNFIKRLERIKNEWK